MVNQKQTKMDRIWEKWVNHYRNHGIDSRRICKDGVIAPKEFYRSETDPRILFILREPNNPKAQNEPEEKKDLRKIFKNGPKYVMGYNLARWATGILEKFPPYEKIQHDNLQLRESLRKTAVINLKKIGGLSQAVLSIVNAYTYQDKDLLLEQINLIRPNVILACGTIDSLIWLLDLKVKVDSPFEKPIKDEIRDVWIIPWDHHPSARGIGMDKQKIIYKELEKQIGKIEN